MAANPDTLNNPMINFTLDGEEVSAFADETILQTAKRHNKEIPHLCYKESLRADGNCRACVVEVEGERTLAPSCCRMPTDGMNVQTSSERAVKSQKMVLELLKSDMPKQGESPYTLESELDLWVKKLQVGEPRFESRAQPAADLSHPAIAVNMDACIQCTRCLRACREEQMNDVIGFANRGAHAEIVFDIADPMAASSCVACGECVQACPTGALMPANNVGLEIADKTVNSTCPYCGVGCLIKYHVKDDKILYTEGRDGDTNKFRLCVKGRYGFNYIHNPLRLTKPLIRRDGVAKTTELLDPNDLDTVFREASWDEALDIAAGGLKKIRDEKGKKALAGLGSAKGSNEEAYLFQKLIRTGFGSNNVDHCTRLCHASSVVALLECLGSGAVSNPVEDVKLAEVVIIIGSNPTVNHPVGATFMKNATTTGTKIILIDPNRTAIAKYATHHLAFRPDTDVALLNGIMHVILDEGLQNDDYIKKHTEDFEFMQQHLKDYSPEKVAPICGIDADTLREVARLYATSKGSMILWGMGVSQHIHGTDNSRCLIALALMTGQIGRPGTGLHPLRGQNNVQGASDVGLIPMVYPDYAPVEDPANQAKFEKLWDIKLDPKRGLTTVEMIHAILDNEVYGMFVEGENPAMSDPNQNHVREAFAHLEHLVVQDIFLTETAGFADVILPASAFYEKDGTFSNTDRRVQMGRLAVNPPGEAKQDLWILQEIANRLGCDWDYKGPEDVFNEMRLAMPSIAGMTWDRIEAEDSLTYPLENIGDPGEPVIFTDGFPTESGKGRFVPASYIHADEMPDEEYPLIFITGRQLEHWHTGSMTRHSPTLDAIEPDPVVMVNPVDLDKLGVQPGDIITIESRRGKISAYARADIGIQQGTLFMAFCYNEASANLITNEALDPSAKIPEFKFCAVKANAGGEIAVRIN
ncbi:formate dehydrogenase major subunit [Bathymodiolus platifrons methanotrophic gill symbiont]|uniref:formate dehydrogenase subunit alpha n=1 Tax=Bathymodiolus platifrons methanotrophic gill symbiont TaxID=113268 RepID=UPI000B419B1C|nr:formate dehydrogenase subunit alpha [Bathymodiolus platifrons methanotrophic gill symbiont]MCK5869147.1 formate dehydrogenase subunit alpha [Methyloprofundus sp.]GAW85993.1 formate dehydrogenase major subunit [Bathymodiolus platifrons methanotrophic gill symbiont]GFO76104.1 formate dehydrogenase major subunit [Bathymodiolus platifrons methanotrophic gill symbiont]